MSLPKIRLSLLLIFTYPSERAYFDESKSTLANAQVTDPAKSGADYGIKDPQVTEALTGTKSETAKVE